METKIIVALILSIGSFIGIIVNIIFSAVISSRQNKIELKKTRIELLERRRIMLQQVHTKIMEKHLMLQQVHIKIMEKHFNVKDIGTPNTTESKFKVMDYFNEIFILFLAVGNSFPNNLYNDVVDVKNEIVRTIGKNKLIEEKLYHKALELEINISASIISYLRDIEAQIQELLKS